MANQILPFCPTDTGTNLPTQGDYAVATDRTNGNQPGVASSKLNNKAIRQATFIASQMAQLVANQLGADVLDDGATAKLLAQFAATLKPYAPNLTQKTTGSGTFNLRYIFYIATGSATIGATYTNNAITFTVGATVASGIEITMTGAGDPAVSGTLTKTGGTGDTTLTFYAFRKPLYLRALVLGGGGGGGGSGTTTTAGSTDGAASTFGTSFLVANGGSKSAGSVSGAGGTATIAAGAVGLALPGNAGGPFTNPSSSAGLAGGEGGSSGGLASKPAAAAERAAGVNAPTNSGAGGGGGGGSALATIQSGAGGGGGGFVDVLIPTPLSTYAYAVGAGGNGGIAGTSGFTGGNGAAGIIEIWEYYQ